MTKFGAYSTGIAQIDDKNKIKLKFRLCPKSTISLLVSYSDMPDMPCFPIGGMKNQRDANLESFGSMEEIIISLTRLQSTTYSLFPSSVSYSLNFEISCCLFSSQPANFFSVKFRLNYTTVIFGNYSMSNHDLTAEPPKFWKTAIPHLFIQTKRS